MSTRDTEIRQVHKCMLSRKWWTLPALQKRIKTATGNHYMLTGLSARIRDLRKPQYGKYPVPKRYNTRLRLYEYSLGR